ncbi:MAG: rhodanese-like domain-containing protein, partial [Candidatus Bipolaricaulota bacterium]
EARVDTSHFSGLISKGVYVDTNDPVAPHAVLTITGTVIPLADYQITPGDVKYLFYVLLDVRSPDAYAMSHLLGAINVPSGELADWFQRLPQNAMIIVYDDRGPAADAAAQSLQEAGFADARSLAGGLEGWIAAFGTSFVLFP